MWKEFAKSIRPDFVFYSPATEEQIANVEQITGITLPQSLRELLLETNGMDVQAPEEDGEPSEYYTGFLYSTDEIIDTHQSLHENWTDEDFGPFKNYLFFASAPNGDFFGFPTIDGQAQDKDIILTPHDAHHSKSFIIAASLKELIGFWAGLP